MVSTLWEFELRAPLEPSPDPRRAAGRHDSRRGEATPRKGASVADAAHGRLVTGLPTLDVNVQNHSRGV